MAYGDPVQQPQQQQPQQQIDDGRYYDDGMGGGYYPGDMWAGKPSQDHALQVREAQYSEVDRLQDEEGVFDDWKKSRRLMLARASRIPGIDTKTYNRLWRRWKYVVARAHSEGKSNILKTMCEDFDFGLELLVSKSDIQMPGMSGIGAMITNQSASKQEIRMPQPQKQIGFWPWSK